MPVGPGSGSALSLAFARKYKVSCALCHNPIPKLTAFGEQFAANGFRFASNEAPRDTINTGDPLLQLANQFPLAMRLEAYAQAYSGGRAATDFQTPYGLKILSSGTISQKLSYYFYTYLAERGEIGGVEDAFLQVNDIGGRPIDLVVGQFQVSDPRSPWVAVVPLTRIRLPIRIPGSNRPTFPNWCRTEPPSCRRCPAAPGRVTGTS